MTPAQLSLVRACLARLVIAEALNDAFVLVVALSFATVLRAAVCVLKES